ncbi:hypothetical protein PV332_10600 [Streptomyces scabiei]|uniref:hypothetical protein n=1 Tax=Streptomyces scabiei TaxID=1930 RepID=UPI0029A1EDDA|nr:hypothetical protein [Streptomyces scabiei]MDX2575930.1 hypothetical protein [Streptomyces scabiei]MDX2794037.1 hypothetical protein [Streptomyces scabiei]MDX2885597.1 hypothetical protein [Streptomyces scabiei]MDX2993450.1 hypothetical protein [Streptomyces scabiei]MDX3028436.1 hypothetical protein [Streptomyces scabiei]
MAKVIASSALTVELSGREVDLIRQALRYSVDNNASWYSAEDADADVLERTLAQGAE